MLCWEACSDALRTSCNGSWQHATDSCKTSEQHTGTPCVNRVRACVQVEGKQPLLTPEDCLLAEEIVKADPEVAAMLRDDYGITDLSLVACDPWSGARATASVLPPLCACMESPAPALAGTDAACAKVFGWVQTVLHWCHG